MSRLFFIIIISILTACSSDSGAYKKSDRVLNSLLKNPPSPWNEINSEGSDYALINSKSKSIFLFNSACRKFESSNLSNLTSSLLSGIENIEILDRKSSTLNDRDAVEVLVSGKLDGVQRFFKIITIQKNSCIYDFMLIAKNKKTIDQDSPSLNEFITRIKID